MTADNTTSQVLVISICHTTVARVSQVHFDGTRFLLRQTPLLNIGSKQGTKERALEEWQHIFALLRWIDCVPVGNTQATT